MMNINDTNYELWLLRYAEQELTDAERTEVEQWLATHPDAAEELTLYSEAPRLQRDEKVRYVAVPRQQIPRQQIQPLWKAASRWAAAAAVIAALMIPGLHNTSNNTSTPPLLTASNTPIPNQPDKTERIEKPEAPKRQEKPMKLEQLEQLEQLERPQELLAELTKPDTQEEPEKLEELKEPEMPETPTPQYVDDLIVYEEEPEPLAIEVTADTEVVYTESGINPIGLFISTFIKVNK